MIKHNSNKNIFLLENISNFLPSISKNIQEEQLCQSMEIHKRYDRNQSHFSQKRLLRQEKSPLHLKRIADFPKLSPVHRLPHKSGYLHTIQDVLGYNGTEMKSVASCDVITEMRKTKIKDDWMRESFSTHNFIKKRAPKVLNLQLQRRYE